MPTDAAPTLEPVDLLMVLLLLVQLAVLRHASRRGRADAPVPPPTPLLLRLPPEVLACEILSFLTHPQLARACRPVSREWCALAARAGKEVPLFVPGDVRDLATALHCAARIQSARRRHCPRPRGGVVIQLAAGMHILPSTVEPRITPFPGLSVTTSHVTVVGQMRPSPEQRSEDPFLTHIVGRLRVTHAAQHVTFKKLSIHSPTKSGVIADGRSSHVLVQECRIVGCGAKGVVFRDGACGSVERCEISACKGFAGVFAHGAGSSVDVRGGNIHHNQMNGVWAAGGAVTTLRKADADHGRDDGLPLRICYNKGAGVRAGFGALGSSGTVCIERDQRARRRSLSSPAGVIIEGNEGGACQAEGAGEICSVDASRVRLPTPRK